MISNNSPAEISFPHADGVYTFNIAKVLNIAFLITRSIDDAEGLEKALTSLNEITQGFVLHKLQSAAPETVFDASNDVGYAMDKIAIIPLLLAACGAIWDSVVFEQKPKPEVSLYARG